MSQKITVERTNFLFIPGQLLSSDYLSMRKRGWKVVGRTLLTKPNQPKVITLAMERVVTVQS